MTTKASKKKPNPPKPDSKNARARVLVWWAESIAMLNDINGWAQAITKEMGKPDSLIADVFDHEMFNRAIGMLETTCCAMCDAAPEMNYLPNPLA